MRGYPHVFFTHTSHAARQSGNARRNPGTSFSDAISGALGRLAAQSSGVKNIVSTIFFTLFSEYRKKSWYSSYTTISRLHNRGQSIYRQSEFPYQIVGTMIERRHDFNLSQRDLAALCGLPHSSVARIESGKSIPNLSTLLRIFPRTRFKFSCRNRARKSTAVDLNDFHPKPEIFPASLINIQWRGMHPPWISYPGIDFYETKW